MKTTFYQWMLLVVVLLGVSAHHASAQLSIKEGNISMQENLTQSLTVNNPEGKPLKWESSKNEVVKIVRSNQTGAQIKAVAPGQSTITVTAQDGSNQSASITVTVVRLIEKITFTNNPGVLGVGATMVLYGEIEPYNATNRELSWSSSDSRIISVDRARITTHKPGTATITATAQDGSFVSESVTIRVIHPVRNITIDGGNLTLNPYQSRQLKVTLVPADAAIQTVSWRSSNEAVATVDRNGLLRTKAVGKTTITATSHDPDAGYPDASIEVTVEKNPGVDPPKLPKLVQRVSIREGNQELQVNEQKQLTAVVVPNDATNRNVTWSSNRQQVATVSPTGLLKAVGAGEATITVTTEEGRKTAEINVKVKAPAPPPPPPAPPVVSVTEVKLDKTNLSLTAGQKGKLKATVLPAAAPNREVTWSSDNEAVASVDDDGEVHAYKSGEAVITVTTKDGGKTARATVKVTGASVSVSGVNLDKSQLELTAGQKGKLKATVLPADATNREVTWSSDNEAVASVDDDGEVHAYKSGEAVITVTTKDGGKTATCKVMVMIDTSNEVIAGETSAWSSYGRLYVTSPVKEVIEIYALTGVIVHRATKSPGETAFDLNVPRGIVIVKGSSGWVRKVKL
ncbi:Ig-like domain-containing protein [Tannerella sp.]|uniref:Ig-like domain-containing protein n=1 Tax=Tannerella sp. TaxID=2382127 RepID=UPI0026DCCCF8|nr:Ig-like domain-containing protein [Tannerella sp.]MDO4704499.1 Ig-like domain-containing protein [Tannerella sp.]